MTWPPRAVDVGDVYYAVIDIRRPFWTEARVALLTRGIEAPPCITPSAPVGICDRIPPNCMGVAREPVCACDTNLAPTTYANDCRRRIARAVGTIAGACFLGPVQE